MTPRLSRRARAVLGGWAVVAVVGPLGWFWAGSLTPAAYSVTTMGTPDYGGGTRPATDEHAHVSGAASSAAPTSITRYVADPNRAADVRVVLVAREQRLDIGGRWVDGFTLDGVSPGPVIRVRQGQLLEVQLRNESVVDGVTLHWHGVDVPNAMDGVAGVTQDAVPVGGRFTYRFIADRAGTYWYHAHQLSNPEVAGGLFGALLVLPRAGIPQSVDALAVAHTYDGLRTINGSVADLPVSVRPGQTARVRVVNTDNGSMQVWSSAPYRLVAVDGNEVNAPTRVTGEAITVAAGARVDLEVSGSARTAARVQVSAATAVLVGPPGAADPAAVPRPTRQLDLLDYGSPAPLGFDPTRPDRRFAYVIGHRFGFVGGRPGLWWSIDGHLYPHTPMFIVTDGDVVTMHIDNRTSVEHPMHLHGHRMVVLARDGVAATGSPWWVDSLNVAPGESYDVAFVADNPGIWMDHCHNLEHAADGMVAHLMYTGVTTPFEVGGPAANRPE